MLDAERWAEVQRIFARASDMPPSERAEFLQRECPAEDLRREVASLLEHASDEPLTAGAAIRSLAASFMAKPADGLDTPGGDPLVGTWLGPYRIASLLARGGMGAVYRAVREDDQFSKQVAIKVVPRVLAGPDAVARFRSERQILANLEHPSIARLLDGGTSEGIPYIVMEYVEGVPITEYVRAQALSIPNRLRLMQSVCAAVLYAHRNLVIHRDLKPGNILVTADGTAKLLDFGLAKLADPTLADDPLTSRMMMTPEYASPEQIQGAPVTTASDVYSLGVVLYEVLTGERPYRITSTNLHELERVVCNTEPRKPSTLETLPARTRRRLAGDLDNIVLMALRKDVSRRYGSVEQLAEDIRRHLQGLPVQARRDTPLYRGGKFLRRNRTAAAAAFLVAASLITGIVIAARQARAARERFDQLRGFARTALVDLHGQLSDVPGTAKARQALVAYVDDYLKRVAAQHAGDDTALATEFATTYLRLGEMQGATPEALASFENGRRLLERKRQDRALSPADSLLLARLRVRTGSALVDLGRTPEGVENLTAGASLAGGLGQAIGWNSEAELVKAFAEWRLARLYRMQLRLPEAEVHSRAAIALGEEILRRGFRTKEVYEIVDGARLVLGAVQRRGAHWEESMETYQKVLADTQKRAQAEPGSAGLQRELAHCHQLLANIVIRVPGRDENEVRLHVRSAIAIAERLAALDPWDKTAQGALAEYLSSGAEALYESQDRTEALSYSRRALPILETLLKSEPANSEIRLYAALTEADIGMSLGSGSPNRQSILWLRRGLSDVTRLVESDPKNTTNVLELIKVQQWLSMTLARAGREPEAVALAQDGIAKARSVAGEPGATPESWRELPRAYAAMADTYRALGKHNEARKWYRVALTEWEKMGCKGVYFPDSEQEIEDARKGASAGISGRAAPRK
jgi:tetratricopeptide (TPR) repeat protein